jgi:hypothetical protein
MGQVCHKTQSKPPSNPPYKSPFPPLQQPLLSNLFETRSELKKKFLTDLTSTDTGEKLRKTELVIRDLVKKRKLTEIAPTFLEVYNLICRTEATLVKDIDDVTENLKKQKTFFEKKDADFLEKNSKTYTLEFQLEILVIFYHFVLFKSENDPATYFFLDRNDRFFFERFRKIMNKCFEEYGLIQKEKRGSQNKTNEPIRVLVNEYLNNLYQKCDNKCVVLLKCDLEESDEEVKKPEERSLTDKNGMKKKRY